MSYGAGRELVPPAGGVEPTPPAACPVLPRHSIMLIAGFGIAAALSGCGPTNDASGVAAAAHVPASAHAAASDSVERTDELKYPLPVDDRRARVLIFLRSDCPISNRYAPGIRELCRVYESQDVEFLLVYPDPRETEASMRSHLSEYDFSCRGVLDPEHRLVTAARAKVTPEAVVYDRDDRQVYRGRIDDRFVDYGRVRAEPSSHDLRDALDACLNDRPVPAPVTAAVGCLISDLK